MARCDYCIRPFDEKELFTVKFDNLNTNQYCKKCIRPVLEASMKMPWHKKDKIYQVSERFFEFRQE